MFLEFSSWPAWKLVWEGTGEITDLIVIILSSYSTAIMELSEIFTKMDNIQLATILGIAGWMNNSKVFQLLHLKTNSPMVMWFKIQVSILKPRVKIC